MRMPESMSENMSNKCHLVGITRRRVICSEGFQKLTQDSQNDALCGPARIIAIINNDSDIKHLLLDSCVSFSLCALAVVTRFAPIRFYKRRRYAQKPLHRAAFSRRYSDILTQRGLCTKKLLYTVCTEVFTQRRTYLHTDALYKDALLARINKGTYRRFTHRTFSTEKPLHRTGFTHVFFYTKNI